MIYRTYYLPFPGVYVIANADGATVYETRDHVECADMLRALREAPAR
jgi:hypothetical protein